MIELINRHPLATAAYIFGLIALSGFFFSTGNPAETMMYFGLLGFVICAIVGIAEKLGD